MKRVTIIGGTGLVGRQLVRCLSAKSSVDQINVYARSERPTALDAKVRWHSFPTLDYFADCWEDSNRLASMSTVIGGDLVGGNLFVSALGTTRRRAGSADRFKFVDYAMNVAWAMAASKAGYQCYGLISSYGADASSYLLYPSTKGRLENIVTQLGFAKTVIARPGLLSGERSGDARFGESLVEHVLMAAGQLIPAVREASIMPIAAADVATGLVDELLSNKTGDSIIFNSNMKNTSSNE